MSAVLGILAVLLVAVGLVAAFLRVDASRLAGGLRLAGPAVLAIVGVVVTITGRAAVGGLLLSGAARLVWPRPRQRASDQTHGAALDGQDRGA